MKCHICPAEATHRVTVMGTDVFFYCADGVEIAKWDLDDSPMPYVVEPLS
jgi:hypothetical protein